MIVLGYRKGLAASVARRGLDAFHVVAKRKADLTERPHAVVTDLENAQEVLRAVLAAGLTEVAGVVTGHEEGVFTAAFLRAVLHLPGNADSLRSMYFRDKYLQKVALPADIPRARCRHVGVRSGFDELAAELGTPFVVKPANGFGAARTAVVTTPAELLTVVGSGRSDVEHVAESFVDGPEICVDGVWQAGELAWASLVKYHSSPLSSMVDGAVLAGQVLARAAHPELFAATERLTARALAALGAPDCVVHLEAFETADGLVFGECAMRLAGALAPEVTELTYGVNLFDVEVALALGEPATSVVAPREPRSYHAYILLRPFSGGSLCQQDFERRFPFVEIDFPDDPLARVGAYGRIGHAIVADADDGRLRDLVDAVVTFNTAGS